MISLKADMRAIALAALVAIALGACGDGLPKASERPIPAQLPEAERGEHRRLPISGAHNFRDIGGYPTVNGRQRVRWGLLYRSDDLAELSRQDQLYLQRLGIKQVSDLRSDAEREDKPSKLPADIKIKTFPMKAADEELFKKLGDVEFLKNTDTTALMKDFNRRFVTEFTPMFADWLRDLAAPDATPQIVHCNAGKDRTGFAVAMLLRIIGVHRRVAMEDYMLSAEYGREEADKILSVATKLSSEDEVIEAKLQPLLTVRKGFLREAYRQMRRQYGSVDEYIRRGLGVDAKLRQDLRQRFLENL